jgi:predicted dehydrogenase
MSLPEFAPHEAYAVPVPTAPLPIVIVGAGGIVRDAHLPAYRKAGFPVVALVDRIPEKAEALAADFDVPLVLGSVKEAAAAPTPSTTSR